ncbi:MAG TPA: hypothetical protein VMD53_19060 [Rhizomicrobium sp.]|nr:hypothetical protein [Rhizomicrobium sp.]
MAIRALLWDFGDTLVNERWMQAPMDGAPRWPDLYREFSAGSDLADRWNIGAATLDDVASSFAVRLGVDAARVRGHMENCCKRLTFFPLVRALSEHCKRPQAIVTVNCGVFSTIVAPHYRLQNRFDPIITSWQSRTLNKADLCDIALEHWNGRYARAECLLIDNKQECVKAWQDRGGSAYHFRSEKDLYDNFAAIVRGTGR